MEEVDRSVDEFKIFWYIPGPVPDQCLQVPPWRLRLKILFIFVSVLSHNEGDRSELEVWTQHRPWRGSSAGFGDGVWVQEPGPWFPEPASDASP